MSFEPLPQRDGPSKVKATCDVCGNSAEVACAYARNSHTKKMEPNEGQARTKLIASGWSFVKGKMRCNSCEQNRKVVPMTIKEKVEAPREPTRAQKREIMDMLATCYDSDAERYRNGDTDETLAVVLGVMPGWVASLREEFFGPAGGNEDMSELAGEIEQFIAQAQEALKEHEEVAGKIRVAIREAQGHAQKLGAIRKAVGERVQKKAGGL